MTRSTSSAIHSPPKAAIAAFSTKKEEVPRRKNPFNDMLRRKSGDSTDQKKDTAGVRRKSEEHGRQKLDLKAKLENQIADLEKTLVIVDQERETLKEETEKLKHQLALAHDAIAELQQQVSEPDRKKELERDSDYYDTSAKELQEHLKDDIVRQNLQLRHKVLQLQDQMSRDLKDHAQQYHESPPKDFELNELRLRLHASEKEAQERLQQLMSLKSSISSLTRQDSQMADSELTEALSQFADRIREWVVVNFRRSKINFDEVPADEMDIIKSIVPNFRAVSGADRLALYQALVSSSMMEIFQEPIIVGLPKVGPLASVRAFADSLTGSAQHEWKRATIRALENSALLPILRYEVDKLVQRLSDGVAHLLLALTSMNLSTNSRSALQDIFKAAVEIQRTMALQKARYETTFFRNPTLQKPELDDRRMEAINDFDSSTDEDGDVTMQPGFYFCIFPCIEKFGDERGEHLVTGNVLLKARVLVCSAANG